MKKLFSLILTICLAVSMVACSSGDNSSTAESSESSSSETVIDENYNLEVITEPTKDPLGKYDPEITVTTVHTGNDGAFWFPEGDSIDNNIYTRRYEEELGIKYVFKWTCPGSQASEKMSTMLASGDLPDFLSVDAVTFEKMYQAGLLEDITVPLVEYASTYTRKYLTGDFKYLMDRATRDGHYYGIPNGFGYQDGGDMIWIRKDWMDKLGLEKPTTLEDLENIMEAFVTQDPDGNGEDDTYAIAMCNGGATYTLGNAFFNIFNAYPEIWYENTKGEIEHGLFGEEVRERTRTAIQTAAEYYQKGYIASDFTTMDTDMRNQDMFNGKCGIYFADVWGAYWPLILHKDVDPEADWIPVPVVSGPYGEGKIGRNVTSVQNILVATKGCEHPEALVKMTNLYHNLNNNPETMEFEEYNTNASDSNQIFLCYPLLIYNPIFNYEGYLSITEAQETGNTDSLCDAYKQFYDQAMEYEENGMVGGWSPYRSYLKDDSSLGVIDTYIKNHDIVFNEYTTDDTTFMIENKPTVKKMYDEMVVSVITGQSDISAFDTFIASYDELYGTQATQEVNDWFEENGGVSIQSQMDKE